MFWYVCTSSICNQFLHDRYLIFILVTQHIVCCTSSLLSHTTTLSKIVLPNTLYCIKVYLVVEMILRKGEVEIGCLLVISIFTNLLEMILLSLFYTLNLLSNMCMSKYSGV